MPFRPKMRRETFFLIQQGQNYYKLAGINPTKMPSDGKPTLSVSGTELHSFYKPSLSD